MVARLASGGLVCRFVEWIPALVSMVTAVVLPVPGSLAADLVESLDHPMRASDGLREVVADPPGGLVAIDEAIKRSLSNGHARPVNELADPHHLADTDPAWAGGDTHRIQQVAIGHAADRQAGARSAQRRTRTRRRRSADRARHPDQPHTEGAPGMTEPTMSDTRQRVLPSFRNSKTTSPGSQSPTTNRLRLFGDGASSSPSCGGGCRAAWLFARPRSGRRRVLRSDVRVGGRVGVRRAAVAAVASRSCAVLRPQPTPGDQRHCHRARTRRRLRARRLGGPRDSAAAGLRPPTSSNSLPREACRWLC